MDTALDGLPRDGTRVRLILSDGTSTWKSPSAYEWNGKRWVSVASGLPLPGSLQIKGWEKADE